MTRPLHLIGRSSSHFTRVVRVCAHELGVPLTLEPVHDMKSREASSFSGNPALKVPSLRMPNGDVLFGTLNLCRAIAEEARAEATVVWPETVRSSLVRNAHEMVWHGMDAQVILVLGVTVNGLPVDNAFFQKTRAGYEGALNWLESRVEAVVSELPLDRRLSVFEVALFCLLEHLAFRGVFQLSAQSHPKLLHFAAQFSKRASAQATPYQFDAPPAISK